MVAELERAIDEERAELEAVLVGQVERVADRLRIDLEDHRAASGREPVAHSRSKLRRIHRIVGPLVFDQLAIPRGQQIESGVGGEAVLEVQDRYSGLRAPRA